jgi:hypothetical protein
MMRVSFAGLPRGFRVAADERYRLARTRCTRDAVHPIVAGSAVVSRVADELPNENPPIEIDIQRAFFVKKAKNISFDPTDGSLSQVGIDKHSEALALSKFGHDVVQTDVLWLH